MSGPNARCELTDLLVESCAHCTGRDGGEQADRARRERLISSGQAIRAQYAGRCSACGEWFSEGEPIQLDRGAATDGFWRASCCIEATL